MAKSDSAARKGSGRGELERAVLQALWEHPGGLTARDVVGALADREPALTTVLTVLDRLRRKDHVTRDETARPHIYRAANSREDYIAELMLDALGQATDREAALTRFLGRVAETDDAPPGDGSVVKKGMWRAAWRRGTRQ